MSAIRAALVAAVTGLLVAEFVVAGVSKVADPMELAESLRALFGAPPGTSTPLAVALGWFELAVVASLGTILSLRGWLLLASGLLGAFCAGLVLVYLRGNGEAACACGLGPESTVSEALVRDLVTAALALLARAGLPSTPIAPAAGAPLRRVMPSVALGLAICGAWCTGNRPAALGSGDVQVIEYESPAPDGLRASILEIRNRSGERVIVSPRATSCGCIAVCPSGGVVVEPGGSITMGVMEGGGVDLRSGRAHVELALRSPTRAGRATVVLWEGS